jgi:hypothetical protein
MSMKKVKVTRKSGSGADFTLYPSRVRITLIYAAFFVMAVLIGMLVRIIAGGQNIDLAVLFSDWYINFGIVVGGAVLFAFMDYKRWTIRVLGGATVEGPSGAMGDRLMLPLKEIDWKRSGRSLRSRIKIGNAIYTEGRKRILISPWFYDPQAYAEFQERIGYTKV